MTAKEYWNKAEQLRKRINRKIHEIHILRQRAEGMNGSSMNDMPKTVSLNPHKMEGTVFKIMTLEQEIKETQLELDNLIHEMYGRIKRIEDEDVRDILTKRYIEFKPWKMIASEMFICERQAYYLHDKAIVLL